MSNLINKASDKCKHHFPKIVDAHIDNADTLYAMICLFSFFWAVMLITKLFIAPNLVSWGFVCIVPFLFIGSMFAIFSVCVTISYFAYHISRRIDK